MYGISVIARSHVGWSLLLDASVLPGLSLGHLLPSAAAGSRPAPAAAAAPHLAATGSPSWARQDTNWEKQGWKMSFDSSIGPMFNPNAT